MRLTAAGMSRPAWTAHAPAQARPAQLPPSARPIPGNRAPARVPCRLRHGALALAALSALALAAAGCSGVGSGGGAGGTVTVGAVPGVDTVPLYLAQHSGQFSADGVSVQIKNFTSVTAEVKALQNGQIDMAAGDYGPFLSFQSQHSSGGIKIVADGYDATQGVLEILALPGAHITTPQSLAGKKIAAPNDALVTASGIATVGQGTPDSLDTAAATAVMRSYGVNMATVTWDPMAPNSEIAALRDHQVDAILVNEPYLYQAQAQLGAIKVMDACSGATAGLPLSGYFAMSSWAASHADAVSDFQSALGKAQASAAMDGPVQNNLPGYTGMTKLEANLVTVGNYPSTTNITEVQRVAALLNNQNILNVSVAVNRMIIR